MTDYPMMECGDVAQGQNHDGTPVCVIHAMVGGGWHEKAHTPMDPQPTFGGRRARCTYFGRGGNTRTWECNYGQKRGTGACVCEQPSRSQLPFFTMTPDEHFDSFFCGCMGWD